MCNNETIKWNKDNMFVGNNETFTRILKIQITMDNKRGNSVGDSTRIIEVTNDRNSVGDSTRIIEFTKDRKVLKLRRK